VIHWKRVEVYWGHFSITSLSFSYRSLFFPVASYLVLGFPISPPKAPRFSFPGCAGVRVFDNPLGFVTCREERFLRTSPSFPFPFRRLSSPDRKNFTFPPLNLDRSHLVTPLAMFFALRLPTSPRGVVIPSQMLRFISLSFPPFGFFYEKSSRTRSIPISCPCLSGWQTFGPVSGLHVFFNLMFFLSFRRPLGVVDVRCQYLV